MLKLFRLFLVLDAGIQAAQTQVHYAHGFNQTSTTDGAREIIEASKSFTS